ncbi:MAG: FAD binding domain-containing protein [Planctomycetes bacterium]|nr:FAD binding domain-containing protein [Planctomycetota bacterium]
MMRLPRFAYRDPTRVEEAVRIHAGEGPDASYLAGGTDLLPNMKRGQQRPRTLVGLRRIEALRGGGGDGAGWRLGALRTLASLVEDEALRRGYRALWEAASMVATRPLRHMGTLGGNLCLDTRCNYYNQNEDWRQAIHHCMKAPTSEGGVYRAATATDEGAGGGPASGEGGNGSICWVAPSSPRCWAVSSTDTAPALLALGARVRLAGPGGGREVPLADLYRNDGICYLTKEPAEIVTEVLLPNAEGWASCYWKLRRRGSFDFPVLSVAVALRRERGGQVREARLVLGAVTSAPLEVPDAARALEGGPLDDECIRGAAEAASRPARPLDNTDFAMGWRKAMVRRLATLALRELRGDDVAEDRRRLGQGWWVPRPDGA